MLNCIYINKKWFYVMKTNNLFCITLDDIEPFRHCKSKQFITKIMCMAAVIRPRWDSNRNEMFDGKIGIWLFISSEKAKRNSKILAKEIAVTKVVEVLTHLPTYTLFATGNNSKIKFIILNRQFNMINFTCELFWWQRKKKSVSWQLCS